MPRIGAFSRVVLSGVSCLLPACASQREPAQSSRPPAPSGTVHASQLGDIEKVDSVDRHPTIVRLKTRDHWVPVCSGPDGRLYTVETKDHRVLLINVTDQQFQAQLPDVHRNVSTGIAGVLWAGMSIERPSIYERDVRCVPRLRGGPDLE